MRNHAPPNAPRPLARPPMLTWFNEVKLHLTFRRPQNASSNCPIHNSYWRASQAPIVHAEYIPLLDNPHLQVVILNLNYPVVLGVVAEDSEPRRHLQRRIPKNPTPKNHHSHPPSSKTTYTIIHGPSYPPNIPSHIKQCLYMKCTLI